MRAGALYGLLLFFVMEMFTRRLPQPDGSIVMWALFAAQLTWAAVICWRRTGLLLSTVAMGEAAVLLACFAVLAAKGRVFPDIPAPVWVLVGISTVSGPVLFAIESRVNRAKWQEWRHYMDRMSLWDLLRFRHIPHLRDEA